MSRSTGCYDDPNGVTIDAYKEAVFARFDVLDGLVEGEFPPLTIMRAADELDALVRAHAVGFIDALDLYVVCHCRVLRYIPIRSGSDKEDVEPRPPKS